MGFELTGDFVKPLEHVKQTLPGRIETLRVAGSMSKTCLTFKPRICPTKMRLDDAFQPLAGV